LIYLHVIDYILENNYIYWLIYKSDTDLSTNYIYRQILKKLHN